ncbi:hypothetical protein GCM10007880_42700 [Mesorhizobium amorphae]|nr:hypothetical protein GCM10007880_42700 [Mesorhizobium amorphae]
MAGLAVPGPVADLVTAYSSFWDDLAAQDRVGAGMVQSRISEVVVAVNRNVSWVVLNQGPQFSRCVCENRFRLSQTML